MNKILKHVFVAAFLIAVLVLPYIVFANPNPLEGLENVGRSGGYAVSDVDETTFSSTLGMIIQIFLGFLGIIFIVLTIWAGYNWMTAGGNEEKVNKAKTTLIRAVIGLIITVSSYAIWRFIFFKLLIS